MRKHDQGSAGLELAPQIGFHAERLKAGVIVEGKLSEHDF